MNFPALKTLNASWFNPQNGEKIKIGKVQNKEIQSFDPPNEEKNGNDWVLILES